jgi:pimeloyl-ACP methyl ester carboxylesterase
MALASHLHRAFAALIALAIGMAAYAGELVKLPTRPGVTVDYWLQAPSEGEPEVVALLFVGGEGAVHLNKHVNGKMASFSAGANMLIRIEDQLGAAPVATALLDSPLDHESGMNDGFRMGADHATDVAAVLDDLHQRFPHARRVLIGTSRGTVSVAYLATRLADRVDGIALTSLVIRSTRSSSGLSGMDWDAIKVPTLLVQHHDDNCQACPYYAVERMASRFPLVTVHGGKPAESDECEPLSHHGFYGKEAEVAAVLRQWMLHQPFTQDIE